MEKRLPRKSNCKKLLEIFESRHILRIFIFLFLFQSVYIAFSTNFGIPPDEAYHYHLIKLYSEKSLDPFLNDQAGYYFLGDATRSVSILYHYIMSIFFRFFSTISDSYIVLRLINIALATTSLLLIKNIGEKLKISKSAIYLSIFMISNTLMFLFLSASINYDNLAILISLTSFSLLISLLKKIETYKFFLWATALLSGILVKIAFAPLALLELIVLLFKYRSRIWLVFRNVIHSLPRFAKTKKGVIVLSVFIIISIVFSERYVVNIIKYDSFLPNCTKIHSVEKCRESALFKRGERLKEQKMNPQKTFLTFSFDWAEAMKRKTFGIMGHKSVSETLLIKYGSWLIFSLMAVGFIRKFQSKEKDKLYLLIISMGYVLVLLFVNYKTYYNTGLWGLALQGRYAFPVLPLLYLLGNHYIYEWLKNSSLLCIYILGSLLLFLTAGIPSYIYATDQTWHRESMQLINIKIRTLMRSLVN